MEKTGEPGNTVSTVVDFL